MICSCGGRIMIHGRCVDVTIHWMRKSRCCPSFCSNALQKELLPLFHEIFLEQKKSIVRLFYCNHSSLSNGLITLMSVSKASNGSLVVNFIVSNPFICFSFLMLPLVWSNTFSNGVSILRK